MFIDHNNKVQLKADKSLKEVLNDSKNLLILNITYVYFKGNATLYT